MRVVICPFSRSLGSRLCAASASCGLAVSCLSPVSSCSFVSTSARYVHVPCACSCFLPSLCALQLAQSLAWVSGARRIRLASCAGFAAPVSSPRFFVFSASALSTCRLPCAYVRCSRHSLRAIFRAVCSVRTATHLRFCFLGLRPAARAFYSTRPAPRACFACARAARSLWRERADCPCAPCVPRTLRRGDGAEGLGAENLLSELNMNILRFAWRYTLDSNRLLR